MKEKYLQIIDRDTNLSWAAYHASQQEVQDCPLTTVTAMLPLFRDDSKSVGMIRHSMDVIKRTVQKLNPAQVPVITLDQPLYAIAKRIQWNWPESHGEDHFILMLGGLHIEMAGLRVTGHWLEDSGWVEALVKAKVASPGTANSLVKVSHVTQARHAHQVTASCLHILLKDSYRQYLKSLEPEEPEPFITWCDRRTVESPHFRFWYTTLQLELMVFTFVRSLRTADFSLYTECLTQLAPWFFSLDHINYARWLPVHIRDMLNLEKAHPEVALEFKKGNFTVNITGRVFSSIALDHAHEQNIAAVKSDGGAVGLTQNPQALRCWMVTGPELVRITTEFEAELHKRTSETQHHDQTTSTQMTFAQHVKSLVGVMKEMGNPFLEESKDLLRLHTKDIVDEAAAFSICQAAERGKEQFQAFVVNRLIEGSTPFDEPIKKNKLLLFSRPEESKASPQVENDSSLFSRLYIECQSRDGDLDDFFRHENQPCPPSLSHLGKLRQGTKADLLSCLAKRIQLAPSQPNTDVCILDGAAVVNFLKLRAAKTFDDYANEVFIPYIKEKLEGARRVDVVWDQYPQNSLKSQTRNKPGKRIRRRVEASTSIPENWQQFLCDDGNKTELFAFLVKHIQRLVITSKQIVTTNGSAVVCSPPKDTSRLAPCNHEEADTRMILHLADAVREGFKKILLCTGNTDVVVLSIAAAAAAAEAELDLQELWVAFGTELKNTRYMPIHEIVKSIGCRKSQVLPMFHAYTGCDTVSSFATRGKDSAWDTWGEFEEVTATFLRLSTGPDRVKDADVATLERFTILLYDRRSSLVNVDEARKQLFTNKGRAMDAIPPTKAALVQHIRRAVYQGGHCWGKALQAFPQALQAIPRALQAFPTPEDWGWTDPSNWKPLWTTLPQVAGKKWHCGCKKGCRGQCKCKKAALNCTTLCGCGGCGGKD